MREIKFRAWDKENKKMWYNVQKAYDNLGSFCKHNNIEDYDLLDICDCKDEEKYTNKMDSFDSVLDDKTLVVMQYTGLKDKNDKEIYEGDILSLNYFEGYVVKVWIEYLDTLPYCCTIIKYSEDDWVPLGRVMKRDHEQFTCEVIGNIYENLELVK